MGKKGIKKGILEIKIRETWKCIEVKIEDLKDKISALLALKAE